MPRSQIFREVVPGFEITEEEILTMVQNKEEQKRKAVAKKRKDFMRDILRPEVDSVLKSMFVEASYVHLRKYLDVSNNLMKRLMKEISLVYQREPERILTKSNQKRYEEISDESHMDLFLAKANYLTNGLNDIILYPMALGGALNIGLLTPDQVSVFANEADPSEAEAYLIEEPFMFAGVRKYRYIFWSPTRHFGLVEGENGRFIKESYNDLDASPYRDINLKEGTFYPFVPCHSDYRVGEFWDEHTGNSLVEATILVAIQNTFKHFMVPQQFKQMAVKMLTQDDNVWNNDQVSNPLHIFTTNGEMTVLDWQSAIDKLDLVIGNKITAVANDYGVSAEQFKLQIQAQSGFARLVAKERLLEMRDEQVKYWRLYEKNLFDAVRATNNVYRLGKQMSDDPKFHVDFAEPKTLTDPMEDLKIKEKKISMGLMSPVELIMQENPDIKTREEAIAVFEQNVSDRNLVQSRLGVRFSAPDITDQGGVE